MRMRLSIIVVGPVLVLLATGAGCGEPSNSQSISGPSLHVQPLTVNGISPPTGITHHPHLITFSGTGFRSGASVTFGGVPGTQVNVATAVLMAAFPPVHDPGTVDVVVTNPNGQRATLPSAFSFHPVTITANPSVAPGQQLTVSWVASGRATQPFDWIGLFTQGASNVAYLEGWWDYTNGATAGTMTFAPRAPGEYEFRYLLDDGYDDVARVPVSVR